MAKPESGMKITAVAVRIPARASVEPCTSVLCAQLFTHRFYNWPFIRTWNKFLYGGFILKFILGLIIGILILPICGYFYFRFGYAPVATAAAPMPFEKKMASMALRARIRAEAPKSSPIQADEPNLTAGAKTYVVNCAFCHGLPNLPPTAASKGMFPVPPQLFNPDDMVTDDPVGTIYWKVDNGIRMTGMPSFNKSLSTTEMWQVSLLLNKADKLPDSAKAALNPTVAAPAKK